MAIGWVKFSRHSQRGNLMMFLRVGHLFLRYNPCKEEIQKVWGQLVIKGLDHIRAKFRGGNDPMAPQIPPIYQTSIGKWQKLSEPAIIRHFKNHSAIG